MRKRILSIMLVLTVAFGTCGAARAAEDQNAAAEEGLKSHGKITYQDGEGAVVIDSRDFYALSERINLVKQDVARQLNVMDTYFTTGDGVSLKSDENIRVAHTEPSDDHAVDPLSIGFDTLVEGIAASQSVPSDVTPAAADNLSAGTAAWVNGELILGTGGDNEAHREEGYKKGLEEGSAGVNRHAVAIGPSKSYTASENISNAFVHMAYSSRNAQMGPPSFHTPDGSSVPCSIVSSEYCNHDESHAGNWHLCISIYYIPKLKAGTVVTIPNDCPRASFIYFTK